MLFVYTLACMYLKAIATLHFYSTYSLHSKPHIMHAIVANDCDVAVSYYYMLINFELKGLITVILAVQLSLHLLKLHLLTCHFILQKEFCKGAMAAFVVYDLSRLNKTLPSISDWKKRINNTVCKKNGNPIPIYLLGNKVSIYIVMHG